MEEYFIERPESWIQHFPLNVESARRWGEACTTLRGLAQILQVRQLATAHGDLGCAVPCDAFVLAQGEPAQRHVTKIGGLPYRPAGKPWPRTPDEEPMRFLVQFCFADSRDIVPELPGDVLLVFAQDDNSMFGDKVGEDLQLEWYSLGLEEVVAAEDVPPPRWRFDDCYGVRWRSVDYPDAAALDAIRAALGIDPHTTANRGDHIARPYAVLDGLKIGGIPHWLEPGDESAARAGQMQFLCSLAGFFADPFGPYPWFNHPEPFTERERTEHMPLDYMDGFTMNFFFDPSEGVIPVLQAGF